MKVSSKEYALALFKVLEESKEEEKSALIRNFASVVAKYGDTGKKEEIIRYFEELEGDMRGAARAELIAAREVKGESEERIKRYLLERTGAEEVEISKIVQEDLLGGAMIEHKNRIIDASIRGSLRELKKRIRK